MKPQLLLVVLFLILLQLVSLCTLALAQAQKPQTRCQQLQNSALLISQCENLLNEFKEDKLFTPGELPDDEPLPESAFNQCCDMLEFGSQNFVGRQCMCQLLRQSSEDKRFLEVLKSVDDSKFLQAACHRSFKIARSVDTCSTPTIVKERLNDVSADGLCKHRLLELKNDVCHNPSDPICCSALNELTKDQDCTCKLSQRKIPGLTEEAFSFFESLVDINGTRFRDCGSSIDTIRGTRSRCLEKVKLSSLPDHTVSESCGASAQVIMEDICQETVKKANQGQLSERGGEVLEGLRILQQYIIQRPTEQGKEAIQQARNLFVSTNDSSSSIRDQNTLDWILKKLSDSVITPDMEFKDSVSSTPSKEIFSFFEEGPAGEDATNFLQRLDKFWEDNKPLVESLRCCNALTGLTRNTVCACLLKQRDASLNLKNQTFEFVDSIRDIQSSLSKHCGEDFDLFTSTKGMCKGILKPSKVVIEDITQCWFTARALKKCKTFQKERIITPAP